MLDWLGLAGWLTLGTLVTIGAVLVAIFVPAIRQAAVVIAATVALGTSIYGLGAGQGAAVCQEGVLREQLKTANASIETLKGRIKDLNDAANHDRERADTAEQERKDAKDEAKKLAGQIADGDCFTDADTRSLRQLWHAVPKRK